MSCASTSLGPKSGLCLKTTSFVTPTRSIRSPLALVLSNAYRAQQAARLHSLDPQLEALTARRLSPPNPALGALSSLPASTRSHGRQTPESAPRTRGACWGVGPRVLGAPGEAPACVEYSVGRKALDRDSPRTTTEPSRGAAILLSRGFLGDQDPCASHWLPEQPAGSRSRYSGLCWNSIGLQSLNSSRDTVKSQNPPL